MQFDVRERLVALAALPVKGTFKTLDNLRALREVLRITEEERVAIDLRQEGEQLLWDTAKDQPKEIELSPASLDILRAALDKLGREGEATDDHLALYEKLAEVEARVVPIRARQIAE